MRREVVYGAHFYLSKNKIEHTRTAFTLIKLLSQIGGLLAILLKIMGFVGMILNR